MFGIGCEGGYCVGGLVLIVCLVLILHCNGMACLVGARQKPLWNNVILDFVVIVPTLTSFRHLDVLVLSRSLYSSHTALLYLFILSLYMFGLVHANSRCGHVSIDWVLHGMQLIFGYSVG
jgi:hypothetical protein